MASPPPDRVAAHAMARRSRRRWTVGAVVLVLVALIGAVKGPAIVDRYITGRRHRQAIDARLLPPAIADLPVVLAQSAGPPKAVVIFISGDGGWQIIDRKITGPLARYGYLMAGLDSVAYFDQRRTPDEMAGDASRIFAALRPTRDTPLVLMGFSFGADVLPFIATRLPADEKAHLVATVFLGLSQTASFWLDFGRLVQWAGIGQAETLPEIAAMGAMPMVCVYGATEQNTPCPTLAAPNLQKVVLPGNHHFDENYPVVIAALRDILDRSVAGHPPP